MSVIFTTPAVSYNELGPIPSGALPLGIPVISVADIDDPSLELGLVGDGYVSGNIVAAIQEPDSPGGRLPFTLYMWNEMPLVSPSSYQESVYGSAYGSAYEEENIPFLIDSAYGGQWVAVGGKYSYQETLHPTALNLPSDIHAADSKATPADGDELALVDSEASYILKKLAWSNLKATIKSYFDTLYKSLTSDDGWTADTDTWVYVSATSFKIEGKDVASRFPVGCKIKITQTTDKYFNVVSAAFSTDTLVTVTAGSDYTIANAAITSPKYSYASCPVGFPQWFNYTPTLNGFSSAPSINVSRIMIVGRRVIWNLVPKVDGVSNANTFSANLPIAAITLSGYLAEGLLSGLDNGNTLVNPSFYYISSGGTVVTFRKEISNVDNAWTNSGAKAVFGNIEWEI